LAELPTPDFFSCLVARGGHFDMILLENHFLSRTIALFLDSQLSAFFLGADPQATFSLVSVAARFLNFASCSWANKA
jgi:hypothetical protein